MTAEIRQRGYSIRTEEAYRSWLTRYLVCLGKTNPKEVGDAGVRTFLQALAVERQVTASTQNQARHAVVFFYQYILQQSLDDLEGLAQAKRPQLQLVEVHRTWPDSAPEIYTSVK